MGKTLTPGFIRVHRKNMRVPQSVSTDSGMKDPHRQNLVFTPPFSRPARLGTHPRPLLLRREGGKVMGGLKFYWFCRIG